MTETQTHTAPATASATEGLPPGRVPVDWRRIRRPLTYVCFSMSLLGAIAASLGSMVAGRLADKKGPRFVVGCAIAAALLAYLLLLPGATHLAALVIGVILLDAGVQAAQVTNQTRIFALAPAAQGRMNTLYMIAYFSGGALGSFAGATGWRFARWPGVCTAGLALLTLAAALRTAAHLRAKPRPETLPTPAAS